MKTFKMCAALIGAILLFSISAIAADKGVGGNCCADLEERVAELEASVAKKGNRKISLQVYGQINKALIWTDIDGVDTQVIDNSVSQSRFGFRGQSKLGKDITAGYVMEIGLGTDWSDDLTIRQNHIFVETALGKVSLGRASTATDGIVELSTANTQAVALPFNLRPFLPLGLFDGAREDIVRYDTPTIGGFMGSVSGNSDAWDVALRYAGEFAGFRFAAGLGYRDVDQWSQTLSGSASLMHMATGLFVNGAYGKTEFDGFFVNEVTGYHAMGGIERKWAAIGATTLFAEYAQLDIDGFSGKPSLFGFGAVQAVDELALDLYATVRFHDEDTPGAVKPTVGTVGARIKF